MYKRLEYVLRGDGVIRDDGLHWREDETVVRREI